MLVYGIWCIILPSYYDLFTLNIFAQLFGALILLTANMGVAVVILIFFFV